MLPGEACALHLIGGEVVPLLPVLSPAIVLHKILIWAMCSFDSYVKNLVMNTYVELLISLIIYPL